MGFISSDRQGSKAMSVKRAKSRQNEDEAILSADVPVTMPDLPVTLVITTAEQFKAISDPIRGRILNIIRHHPSTAKQIAQRLNATPGAIGHHMQVLEKAGLAQIVARRMIRGIVAKYYTRTARIFMYDMPPEVTDNVPADVHIMTVARDELAEVLHDDKETLRLGGFPHARLSPERAQAYAERLNALMQEFLEEPNDETGDVYGLSLFMFRSPEYLQPQKQTDQDN
jgi:DNA-binding transcriptional ArsR family regulator